MLFRVEELLPIVFLRSGHMLIQEERGEKPKRITRQGYSLV
jgi:hypothetical protein